MSFSNYGIVAIVKSSQFVINCNEICFAGVGNSGQGEKSCGQGIQGGIDEGQEGNS